MIWGEYAEWTERNCVRSRICIYGPRGKRNVARPIKDGMTNGDFHAYHNRQCDVILEGIGDEEEDKRVMIYSKWSVKV